MEEILLFLRTSLRKNPEEWSFVEQTQGLDMLGSVMNIFFHEPTEYVLFLIQTKTLLKDMPEPKTLYYVHLIEEEEYIENIESAGLRLSLFSPNSDFTYLVNENSSIVKTLNFIKYIALEDEKLLKYENFKNHIREKNKPIEKEVAVEKVKAKRGKRKKTNGDSDNIPS